MRWFIPLLVASACAPTYSIRRSAHVEHIQPSLRTGAPLKGPVEFEGHISAITPPTSADDTSGLYVSKVDFGAAVRARLTKGWDLDGLAEGSSISSFKTAKDIPDQPPDSSYSFGVGTQLTTPIAPRWWLAFAGEILAMNVPYHTHLEDVTTSPPTDLGDYYGSETVAVASAALILRYEPVKNLGLFGSFTARNHPTNSKGSVETTYVPDTGGDIDAGPLVGILSLGADVRLNAWGSVQAQAFLPLASAPVKYGLGFVLGMTFNVPEADPNHPLN